MQAHCGDYDIGSHRTTKASFTLQYPNQRQSFFVICGVRSSKKFQIFCHIVNGKDGLDIVASSSRDYPKSTIRSLLKSWQ